MGLHVGEHLVFHMEIDGKLISRKYTPVSKVNDLGKVEFVIKIYKKNEEFPLGGKIT